MEFLLGFLTSIILSLIARLFFVNNKTSKLERELEKTSLSEQLINLSVKKIKLKNQIDNTPLDSLVKHEDSGNGENPK